jgi:hypothetical protein
MILYKNDTFPGRRNAGANLDEKAEFCKWRGEKTNPDNFPNNISNDFSRQTFPLQKKQAASHRESEINGRHTQQKQTALKNKRKKIDCAELLYAGLIIVMILFFCIVIL